MRHDSLANTPADVHAAKKHRDWYSLSYGHNQFLPFTLTHLNMRNNRVI